jgi:hypothetical protein
MKCVPNDPARRCSELIAAMRCELHELCQPLTALLCVLEIGRMAEDPGGMREALDCGMEETRRVFDIVARMRATLSEQGAISEDALLLPTSLHTAGGREN